MEILKQLLDNIVTPNADLTQQITEICDKITEEESSKVNYPELLPQGSNVFLSLEISGRYNTEIGFITLEREDVEKYIVVYHTLEKSRIDKENPISPRRRKVWEINEHKANKILIKFATILKMLNKD